MGILNVTPDSFSDGGKYLDPGLALLQALKMQEEGAHLLDIGGESSRPGSKPISAKEEIRRLRPVFKRLAGRIQIPISVDTYKYDVASMALDEGAALINDIYALRGNKRLARLIARHKAGVVLMHMRGNPRTMQKNPAYKNFMKEVAMYLKQAVGTALSAGISRRSIILDPGFGFGKTAGQNQEMLKNFEKFGALKFPLLAGLSRKSFIGHFAGGGPHERLYGSIGAAAVALMRGAHILRVHEVLPHKHLAVMMDAGLDALPAEKK